MEIEFDPAVLGERASYFVTRLASEIGPRPAGQAGEARAADLAAEQLADWGYALERYPFDFAPAPRFFPYYSLLGTAFVLSSILLSVQPWLSLFLPVLAGGLPLVSDWLLARLPRSVYSANLLAARPGAKLEDLDLIFCAHLDTARAIPFCGNFLHSLSTQIDDGALRLGLILAATACFPIFGVGLTAPIYWAALTCAFIMAAVLFGLDLWQQLGERGRFTPGVSDNASGVGVLLALAELLANNPPEVLRLGFLFTSAEECGLYGAEAFARLLKQRGLRPNVLAVDMVGSGSCLRLVRESGPIFPVRSDVALNGWIELAEPEIQSLAFTRRSSDFAAFAKNGIPAAWVESNGTPYFWRVYHTLQDGLALADAAVLGRTTAVLTRLVLLLERDKSRDKSRQVW